MKCRIPVNRFKYLRQNISLTGLGSSTFTRALDAAQMIYKHFDRQFPEGLLDSWSPTTHATNPSLNSLDISNRYLTPLRDVSSSAESVPFHKGVDPRNILTDMAKNNHIHTEDNYVEYFSTHRDSDGQRRQVKKSTLKSIKRNSRLIRTQDSSLANRRCSEWAILFKCNCLLLLFR